VISTLTPTIFCWMNGKSYKLSDIESPHLVMISSHLLECQSLRKKLLSEKTEIKNDLYPFWISQSGLIL
jgi:hypothetical protein